MGNLKRGCFFYVTCAYNLCVMEKQKKLPKLKFYYVDEGYANFLRKNYDPRVPNITNEDYTNKKFFIGVVMKINGFNYFAPVSSYNKENNLTFNIKNNDGDIVASIRPNYMFPLMKDTYKLIPINKLNSKYYKYFVQYELRYCNKHRAEICALAEETYKKRIMFDYRSSKERKMYETMCCNFARLEQGAKAYQDKSSKLLSDDEKLLIEKYPIDAKKLLQIKTMRKSFIDAQPDKLVALEQCIRTNIKFAPELYGKEVSERITKEDSAVKQKAVARMAPVKKVVTKTQEKITPKQPKKKNSQNSR